MNLSQLLLLGLLAAAPLATAPAAEPPGEWKAPAADGRAWRHAGTSLSFPQHLGTYRLAGEFLYKAGGVFIRYESLEEQARADIFLFPTTPGITDVGEKQRIILKEMEAVVTDMQSMEKQGRYRNVLVGELGGGGIDQWKKPPLPVASRIITATRMGRSEEGPEEAIISQWIGITVVSDHILTIRHMHPTSAGEQGEAGLKAFVGMIFQVVKDPPLRAELAGMVETYLADPFSDAGQQAATAVLAYLKQTPFYTIGIPEDPFTLWLSHCKAAAPGTESLLLGAFMVGAAKSAFADADPQVSFNDGARQFALMYRQLRAKNPAMAKPEIEEFAAAAEKGQGAKWLQDRRTAGSSATPK